MEAFIIENLDLGRLWNPFTYSHQLTNIWGTPFRIRGTWAGAGYIWWWKRLLFSAFQSFGKTDNKRVSKRIKETEIVISAVEKINCTVMKTIRENILSWMVTGGHSEWHKQRKILLVYDCTVSGMLWCDYVCFKFII